MASKLEPQIQRIGQEIFSRMEKESPSVFRKDYWNGKIMDWSMRDEAFKVEMFRFVDVFPVLRTPEVMARHLQEYFCRPEQDFPAWIQLGLKSVSATSFIARTAASQIEKNIRGMAAGFVAGETAADALPRIADMRAAGIGFTVDLLGEASVSDRESLVYQRRYLELVQTLAEAAREWSASPLLDTDDRGSIPRVNISIKVSSLFAQIDPIDPEGSIRALHARLLPIFVEGRRLGAFLNLDMEQSDLREITWGLFRSLLDDPALRGWDDAGIVVQAYLRSAVDDTRSIIEWSKKHKRRITVRLVKGAYWDYETVHAQQRGWPIPVFQNKWETDASFEECAELLLRNHKHIRTAIGSHNVRSIAAALALAESAGVPRNGLELQMLYGMAEPIKQSARAMGARIRDYVPVGDLVPGMAYLVRRLLENTSNEGFLRARFVEQADAGRLLAPPSDHSESRADPTPDSPFLNEPLTDFSASARRDAYRAALAAVRKSSGRKLPLVIDGKSRISDRVIVSTNPANPDEILCAAACATASDADDAVRAAWAAFPAWRDRPVSERASLLRTVAGLLRERRDEIAACMTLEAGKQWREADADVAEAIDFCRYYADEAERLFASPQRLGRYPGELNQLSYLPMGVGAVIAPWNFPLAILCGMAVGPLAAGNCVIMKPAEQTPGIAHRLMEVFQQARLPSGVVQYVPGIGEEVGAHLVSHPQIRFVAFTGSRDVGLEIIRRAHDTRPEQPGVRRVVVEMGGKNAIIVDDDADLDEAVKAVIQSAFGFQGQKCSACSRAIVLDDAWDAFVPRLVEAARSLPIGPPEDPTYAVGPVIDADAKTRVLRWIEIGRSEGTPLLVRDVPARGHYAPIAIFGDIEPKHRLAQEEIFGPVLAVMRARDFGHAIEIANSTNYALTGAVISRSPANIERARREFQVGNLYINRGCTGALVFRQPFGGFRYSGIGAKAGGPDYLRQFVHERAVSENSMRRGFAPEA